MNFLKIESSAYPHPRTFLDQKSYINNNFGKQPTNNILRSKSKVHKLPTTTTTQLSVAQLTAATAIPTTTITTATIINQHQVHLYKY